MSVIGSYLDDRRRSWLRTAQLVALLVRSALVRTVRWIGFWAAVLLPFLWLPLLVEGVDSGTRFHLLVALMLANLVSIALGHGHSPEFAGGRRR